MNKEALERELEAAYKSLEAKEKQVSNLLIERNESFKIMDVLKAAGFITDEKIGEARDLIQGLEF